MAQLEPSIYLIGFMGSGKSTVAAVLGLLLQRPVVDLDMLIVTRSRRSIATLFRDQGEAHFRQLETEALRSLSAATACIVATGGGIVGSAENWRLMRENGVIVYLQARWETLQPRLQRSDERPLANPEQGWDAAYLLLQQRLPLYAQADFTVVTDGLTPTQVAEQIVQQLQPDKGRSWNR